MKEFLSKNKVVVCVGSGGVGKTTVSASLGVAAAQQGLKVIVITIDPAKRLVTSLGLSGEIDHPKKVELVADGELYAVTIDAQKEFGRFIKKWAEKAGIDPTPLTENILYKQLSTTLSGSQEFTSLVCLLSFVQSEEYDLVILDTPPAQNANDFLQAPVKLQTLFQTSVTDWFLTLTGRSKSTGFFKRLINKGTRAVLNALELVTGKEFVHALASFFESIHDIQAQVNAKSAEADALLKHQGTAFFLVTGFDDSKLKEAKRLAAELKQGSYNLEKIIINKAFPGWWEQMVQSEQSADQEQTSFSNSEVESLFLRYSEFLKVKEKSYSQLKTATDSPNDLIKLPELNQNVYGVEGLEALASCIKERWPQ